MGMLMHRHLVGDNTPTKEVREEKPKEVVETEPKAKPKKTKK